MAEQQIFLTYAKMAIWYTHDFTSNRRVMHEMVNQNSNQNNNLIYSITLMMFEQR